MKKIISFSFLVFCCTLLHAQKVFEFNSTCQQAYQEIVKLKINSGLALVEKAKQQNPNNLIPILLESYADFYILFLNEDPRDYAARYPKFAERYNLIAEGPKTSPFYNYSLSMVKLHQAASSVKFGKMWDAGWGFRKSYQLIKENKKQFPTFSPNDFMYGSLHAVVGTIPKGYKWIASLFGMQGSLTEGMKTVRGFINSNDPWAKLFFNEAAFMYPYLMFYIENKKDEALAFTQQRKLDLVNNHLHAYMAANLGINNKQSEYAENIILNRNKSAEYLKTNVWDFELGFTKLYHLETQEAAKYLETFVANFKGKFYLKDAYQKLSWCYYLQGNQARAEETRKNILTKGATDSDADKQALKDAKSGTWPNVLLLKARLLSDGGYNSEAAGLLQGKTEDDFTKEEDKLEFAYRVARIYEDLGRPDDAIRNYLIAIRLGKNRKEYFAARAALQIGQIYEKRGQKSLAISYYQECLNMEDHEYKNSLDQRAKSGIARCKGE
jgi:tetratricopeptide (TPR) repeat protein